MAASGALSRVPDVEIDGSGVFKYVLVRVRAAGGPAKDVVRGHGWAEYHGEGRGAPPAELGASRERLWGEGPDPRCDSAGRPLSPSCSYRGQRGAASGGPSAGGW